VNVWASRIIRMQEQAFPAHHMRPVWSVALLIVPMPFVSLVTHEPFAFAIVGVAWLGIAVPLALIAVLDWARSPPPTRERFGSPVRSAARLAFAALGILGAVLGAVVIKRVVAAVSVGRLTPWQAVFPTILSLVIVSLGIELVAMSRREVPGSARGSTGSPLGRDGV
jgi:hypothetical protein